MRPAFSLARLLRAELHCVTWGLLLALSSAGRAQADWRTAGRVQSSYGGDSNVDEALDARARQADQFFRILGEAELERDRLPLGARASLGLRGFREDYRELSREKRAQGEARLSLLVPLTRRGSSLRLEAAGAARSYPAVPDSASRDYDRKWLSLQGEAPLGPSGVLRTSLRLFALDFHRTPRPDQWGSGFDLTYEHPLRGRLVGQIGFELAGTRHGTPSVQWGDPDQGRTVVVGPPDQRDTVRHIHVGVRWMRRALVRLQYGFRTQSSNSLGSSFHRHEVRWLGALPVPFRLTLETYGNVEHTDYTDSHLEEVYIFRGGEEVEARDDNNQVALGATRPLFGDVSVELRHAWYRNESLLLETYYTKRVWSLALGWNAGRSSVF
ncbi:MAG: hypothetical protein U0527_14210 [Candidatus Eisenbacteria bacterium]